MPWDGGERGLVCRLPPRRSPASATISETKPPHSPRVGANAKLSDGPRTEVRGGRHPAAQKLLTTLAQHAPARFTWGQAATLAGLKPSGGHFNAGRKSLRDAGYVAEANDLVEITPAGLTAAGEVPPAPSTPAERLALWCDRLPVAGARDAAQPGLGRRALHGCRRARGGVRQKAERGPLEFRDRGVAQQ